MTTSKILSIYNNWRSRAGRKYAMPGAPLPADLVSEAIRKAILTTKIIYKADVALLDKFVKGEPCTKKELQKLKTFLKTILKYHNGTKKEN